MQSRIQLIVGLGNPGQRYEATRHNAGALFVEMLAKAYGVSLQLQTKFQGRTGCLLLEGQACWLLIPEAYMNHSGQAVRAIAHFYRIPPEGILVAHDELDFPAGTLRLKQGGGHGGHNGLRDIIHQLHSNHFHRLRIGIGHPGHRDQVTDYVLSKPSKRDLELIQHSFESVSAILALILTGKFQQAIQQLHSSSE